MNFISKYSD